MSEPPLRVGDRAPLFVGKTPNDGDWWLSEAAGRYTVLCFLDSATVAEVAAPLAGNDQVTVAWLVRDRPEATNDAVTEIVLDEDGRIAERYWEAGQRGSIVLDPNLRVLTMVPLHHPEQHAAAVARAIAAAPSLDTTDPSLPGAPVLVVPRVLEPDFCELLIAAYEEHGGSVSGFVRTDESGQTVQVVDPEFKRRKDILITDQELRRGLKERIERRLVPEIRRAFQFTATRIERYLVACYDSSDGGHFRAHRDNTTKGTAHRKFAVTINLNSEFGGGDLRFPEFGRRTYRAPVGGAIVFSCSLLHEATAVTAGRRYCTIPFLYDEAGEEVRRRNLQFVDSDM